MSSNESFPQSDEVSSEQAITIQPSGMAAYSGAGEWMPAGEAPASDAPNAMAVLHAVRRHLLVILSTGLACAAVTGVSLWWVLKPQYKAQALLELKPSVPTILGLSSADQAERVGNEFEIFRENQQNLLKSRFVIMAALRDPKLKNRACILREDAKHNTIAWLTDALRIDIGKNSGIMQVSSTQPDRDDAAAIVNAVIEAYMTEVVNYDRQLRRERLSELQQISAEKESEVRTKREQLKQELANLGVADEQSMGARIQLTISLYADFERQFQGMRAEHRVLLGRLQEAKRTLTDLPSAEIPETEVLVALNTNPMYRDLTSRLGFLEQMKRIHEHAALPGTKDPPAYMRTKADYDSTKSQLDELEQKSRDMVRSAKRIALELEIKHLESQVDVSTEQMTTFEKEVEKKRNEAEAVGRSSVAAQMARSEVENIEKILRGVAEERERLRVELRSPSRVTVLGDKSAPAAIPENEAHGFRYLFIIAGALAAMFGPGLGIVMIDLSKARINSASDVSKRLKIPVIGAIPMIPPGVMRRLGDGTQRSQLWKMRFTESVDGVAVRLMRKAGCDQTRVVLITSAMAGEGKTTVATQLAMSLARSRRKTVLVDFDLRRPTLDAALGLPREPGICEALHGRCQIMDAVRPTETEHLFAVTAGSWSRHVGADLSNGGVGTLLEQLRANFDFVVVDSGPLLPIVDSRLVCQHVDAVVLSVFRDVSQGAKILAAQELLEAFGVHSVEAVITGGEENAGSKHQAYHVAALDDYPPAAESETEIKS